MKRYNLLTENDLIKGKRYECVSLFGNNPHPRSESIYLDSSGYWSGIPANHTVLTIIDNSVMLVLAKENPERYREIVLGGSYDDGEYNDKWASSSYKDCEEIYPVKNSLEDSPAAAPRFI